MKTKRQMNRGEEGCRQAEQALQESERKFKALFNNLTDALFFFELEQGKYLGKFLEVNDMACKKLGYSREELLSLTPADLNPREEWTDLPEIIARLRANGHIAFERSKLTKEGKRIPVEINAHIFQMNGRTVCLSVIRDITERKRAEQKLLEMKKEVEKLRQIAMLGTLAAGIAHEIMQPLNAISLLIDTTLYHYKQGKYLTAATLLTTIDKIAGEAERIYGIIDNMRSLVKNAACPDAAATCNINSVLAEALERLQANLATRGIKVKTFVGKIPLVKGNPLELQGVIVNLLKNAVEAFANVEQQEKEIACVTWFEQGKVILEIRDNAGGIKNEIAAKLFEPFFSTKEAGKGMGLGLTIAQAIVLSLGGHLRACTNERGGATFRVELPAV